MPAIIAPSALDMPMWVVTSSPGYTIRFDRDPNDEPVIVEAWL